MRASDMVTLDDVFEEFGGPAEVGRAIGKSTEHAASMRRRGSIPVEYWPALLAQARGRGIRGLTYELLVRIHVSNKGENRGATQSIQRSAPTR